jgi:hypothetical protein
MTFRYRALANRLSTTTAASIPQFRLQLQTRPFSQTQPIMADLVKNLISKADGSSNDDKQKTPDGETASDRLIANAKATKVEYRRLGNSGLKVSVPIFGCMSIGTDEWQPWVKNEAEALPLLKAAYDRGLNTV